MEPITFLTYLTIILIVGIVCTILSVKLRVSNVLLLIVAGIIIGNLQYKGNFLVSFPQAFLTIIATFALVLIVFDSSSKFKLRDFTGFSLKALKLAFVFLLLNAVFLTLFTWAFYSVHWVHSVHSLSLLVYGYLQLLLHLSYLHIFVFFL